MDTLLSSRRTISGLLLLILCKGCFANTWISNAHLLWDYAVFPILARVDVAQRCVVVFLASDLAHLHRYLAIIGVVLLFRAILVFTTAVFPGVTISSEVGTVIRITRNVLRSHFQALSLTFNFPGSFTSLIILFVNCRPIFLQLSASLNMIQEMF